MYGAKGDQLESYEIWTHEEVLLEEVQSRSYSIVCLKAEARLDALMYLLVVYQAPSCHRSAKSLRRCHEEGVPSVTRRLIPKP